MKPDALLLIIVMFLCLRPCCLGHAESAGGLQETRKEFTNSVGMRMVRIEPGAFRMGIGESPIPKEVLAKSWRDKITFDEQPAHYVTISRPFYMGACEVTNAQYEQFDPAHRALRGKLGFSTGDDEAVVFVDWHEATKFCQWLSNTEGTHYRLPTEAEWEYACRAGTTTAYQWGDEPDKGHGWCNAADLTGKRTFKKWWDTFPWSDGYVFTAPVGWFKPNAWGLSDMHGNVWEWCSDWYEKGYYARSPREDPAGPTTGQYRVLRGGSWDHSPAPLRSANRFSLQTVPRTFDEDLWNRGSIIGFRCAAGAPPPSP